MELCFSIVAERTLKVVQGSLIELDLGIILLLSHTRSRVEHVVDVVRHNFAFACNATCVRKLMVNPSSYAGSATIASQLYHKRENLKDLPHHTGTLQKSSFQHQCTTLRQQKYVASLDAVRRVSQLALFELGTWTVVSASYKNVTQSSIHKLSYFVAHLVVAN